MLKNILKIKGVKELSKAEQKRVTGGSCDPEQECCWSCYTNFANRYYIYPGESCLPGWTQVTGCH